MTPPSRRQFLKRTGAVLGVGGALATGGLVVADQTSSRSTTGDPTSGGNDLPPLRGPYATEDWVEYRSGPGNTAAISMGPDVDTEHLECSCLFEGNVSAGAAVVEDRMYLAEFRDDTWRVLAIDAFDGSTKWQSHAVEFSGPPAAAYERIFVGTTDGILALDIEDGRTDWATRLGQDVAHPVVAYESVFVWSDDAIYAVNVEDGSIRWRRGPEETDEAFSYDTLAASAGQVYAREYSTDAGDTLVALDAMTGERRWSNSEGTYQAYHAATEDLVTSGSPDNSQFSMVDAATGDLVERTGGRLVPALDDEAIVTTSDATVSANFFDDRNGWSFGPFTTGALGPPTIAGGSVYVYMGDDGGQYDHSVVALDKYEGDVQWTQKVEEVDHKGGTVLATSDAVYALGDEQIHVLHGDAVDQEH